MLLYLPTHSRVEWVDRDTSYAVVDVTPELAARWLAVIDRTRALAEELGAPDLELAWGDWTPDVYTDFDMDHLTDEDREQLEEEQPLTTTVPPPETLEPTALAYCTLTTDSGGLWWCFSLGEGAAPEATQYVSRALVASLCQAEGSRGRDG